MAWRKSPEALVQTFASAAPADERVEHRRMFGYPCCFANGHMFAGLHQEDVVVRLAEAARADLLALPGARPFEPMPGRRMREYVVLPRAVAARQATLAVWLERAFDFAASLPPKSPRRRRLPRHRLARATASQ